jgi:quercetin dioxygenase-like cupin family protein
MEIQTLSSNPLITKDYVSSDYTKAFNLPALIESMKMSLQWANKELNAMILLKGRNKQIILTSIHDGTEIESFQSKDSVTFHILEGKLKLSTIYDTVILTEGQLMTITNKIKYHLTTEEDTVFLLTASETVTEAICN